MAGQSSMREVVKKNATSSHGGDDFAMVNQMNCYSFVPEDDTTSSNEEDPFGVDADGDGCQEADEQMWSINGVWRCAVCEKNIRGTRHNRWKHIAMHKKFKVSCPFAACGKYLTPESLRYQHLPRCHNIKGEELDESMQAHMQSEREKHFAEAKNFEREFFPEENVSEVKPLENDTCKYCGTKVASQKCQEAHIAAHLEMHVVCPVPECDKRYKRLTDIYRHFREAHDQLTMSEELKEEWREAKKAYHNAAAEARNLYF